MELLGITEKYYTKAIDTKLSIYNTSDDTIIHEKTFDIQISSIHSSSQFLLLGLCTGPVILLNYTNNNEFTIYNFLQKVTCVFNYGHFYYFGSESGKVVTFIINQDTNSDSNICSDIFSNNDLYNYRIIEEVQHNAPIVHIASDGENTFVFDCRGKITVYPENSAYDMLASCMQYKKHLFVSEKRFLYCKTSQAFACVLSLNDTIQEFCFSNNGGVIFIRTKSHINVYNKNFRILNKISFKNGKFVFDEINNRLILLNKEKIKYVNNVVNPADHLNEEMDEFVFEANKINEVKVHLQDDDEEFVIKNARPNVKPKIEKYASDIIRPNFEYEEEQNYNNDLELFEDEEEEAISEHEDDAPILAKQYQYNETVTPFMPTKYEVEGVTIFCYNKYGYVIKNESCTEFLYHNIEMQKKEFRNIVRLGCISDKGCLFVEEDTLYFDGETSWEKEIKNIVLIDITNCYIICVTTDEITFLKFSGIKVISCMIQNPITICSEDKQIALFCKDFILFYTVPNNCECIPFKYNINFCCFDADILYFTIENKIYMFKHNMIIYISDFVDNPLIVKNHHLLTCNDKLYPVPNINFTKLKNNNFVFDHTQTAEEQDIELVIKIEDALKDNNTILADDYIDLLSNNEIKEKYLKPIYSTDTAIDEKHTLIDDTQVLTSLLYEDTSEINKENDEVNVKKKRFNPFAKK